MLPLKAANAVLFFSIVGLVGNAVAAEKQSSVNWMATRSASMVYDSGNGLVPSEVRKLRARLQANPEQRALVRTIVQTTGAVAGKFLAAILENKISSLGGKIGTRGWSGGGQDAAYGLINGKVSSKTALSLAIPKTVAAFFALAFDAAMEKEEVLSDAQDEKSEVKKSIPLSIASAAVEAVGAFIGFERTDGGLKAHFGTDDGKGCAASNVKKLAALLLSTGLNAAEGGLHEGLDKESLFVPVLKQLQNVSRFVDSDAVEWHDLYGKNYLGTKKIITGSICKALVAMLDGRILSKQGKSAKWNSFATSLIGAWTSVLLAPVVDTVFTKAVPHCDFSK